MMTGIILRPAEHWLLNAHEAFVIRRHHHRRDRPLWVEHCPLAVSARWLHRGAAATLN